MNAEKPVSKNTHVMCRCSLTVLIFAGASHAVLLVCQSTSNVLPVIRNGKDCYSFPVFKVFLPGRNCCSRFYQCRLIQNEYLKKQRNDCRLNASIHRMLLLKVTLFLLSLFHRLALVRDTLQWLPGRVLQRFTPH